MNPQLKQLEDRVAKLEKLIKNKEPKFQEEIRNIVIFDIDNVTATTHSLSGTDSRGDTFTITVSKNPDTYLRVYFRGQVYNIPAYKIT